MLPRFTRHVLTGLALALTSAGCAGGGDDTTADPTEPNLPLGVVMSVTGSAFTVRAGGTTTIPVSITRQGGYVGTVDVTVTGLPSGVRASVTRISVPNVTTEVTITANSTAPASAAASYNVTAQAQAITITPRPITLTVAP